MEHKPLNINTRVFKLFLVVRNFWLRFDKPVVNLQLKKYCTISASVQTNTSLAKPCVIGEFQSSRATWTERKRQLNMFW